MKLSQTNASPFPEGQSLPAPKTLQDLKKLHPRTQAVILGKAIAMRKAKDAKLRSQLAIKDDENGDAFIAPKKPNTPTKV